MSRCFPFPPPGYERKLDDTDLLKKEKSKDKKHKKDKKDREKKDVKEKTDERKHREKKDKQREKKKNKEKRVDHSESQNWDPLFQNNDHIKQNDGFSSHKKSFVQPINGVHKQQLHIRKEEYVQPSGQNEKLLVNRIKTEEINNTKFVQELSRRITEDEKRIRSLQFPVEIRKSNVDQVEIPKMDGQGMTKKSTFNRMSTVQNMIDGKKSLEKVKEKSKKTELTKAEGDKSKYLKNNDLVGSLNNLSTYNAPNVDIQHSGFEVKKRKDMEANGFSHENEPRPNKSARNASNILSENGRNQDFLQNTRLSRPSKSTKIDTKERKVNGTIASQPMSPISKKPPIDNANHILVKPTSARSPPVNTNHIPSQPLTFPNHITNKPLPVISTKPLLDSKKKESIRPPHPDTKYLKQILAVPELDHWSGLNNQEWLFINKDYPQFKEKSRNMFLQDNKEIEVWSETKQLESVDVFALPYVIPY